MRAAGGICGCGLALVLAGCAAGGNEAPPMRPVVDVQDHVGAVDRGRIVGAWQCRDLNPYPDQIDQLVHETYAADGSYHAESRPAPRPPLGALVVTVRGSWAVAGDKVVTSGLKTEARSTDGDANTDMLAGLGAEFVNSYAANQADSAADVLELGAGRLVLRPVGVTDPPVIACTR